jgi:hypothetical protein
MDPKQQQRVMHILAEAIEHEPGGRDAWIANLCAGDEALREEVGRLLAHQEAAESFLEEPPIFPATQGGWQSASIIGHVVGPYKIVREVGRGGMGAVYLAERDDGQFAKRVAIKVIKRGMNTDFVIGRFRKDGRY